MLTFNFQRENSITILYIKGDCCLNTLAVLRAAFESSMEPKPEVVAIDCSGIEFIDSSAIGSIVNYLKTLNQKSVNLVLFGMKGAPQKIFKTAKLDKFFTVMTKKRFERNYLGEKR